MSWGMMLHVGDVMPVYNTQMHSPACAPQPCCFVIECFEVPLMTVSKCAARVPCTTLVPDLGKSNCLVNLMRQCLGCSICLLPCPDVDAM